MLTTTLLSLFFACGDAEEKQKIPPPPAKRSAEKSADGPAAEASAAKEDSAKEETNDGPANMAGTKPEVKVSEKLITTGEIKAAQAQQIKGKVEKALKDQAKKLGFSDVQNIKMIKNECKAGGTCVAIGQGTAVTTTITYSVGNSVGVKQVDGNKPAIAIIKKIEEGKYTVQFANGSEAIVEESALGLLK